MHHGSGGLQNHSIGDHYPWSIVVYSQPGKGGFCRAENLITGEVLSDHSYVSAARDGDFAAAHRRAESEIPQHEAFRQPEPAFNYADSREILADLGYPGPVGSSSYVA